MGRHIANALQVAATARYNIRDAVQRVDLEDDDSPLRASGRFSWSGKGEIRVAAIVLNPLVAIGELLRQLLFGWWQHIGGTRLAGVPKLIVSESRNFPELAQYYHDKVIVRGRALLRSVLQRGIASGEFRALNVETAIDVIIAPLLMLVIWRFSLCFCGREIDADIYLGTHFDLLVHGLCPQKGIQ